MLVFSHFSDGQIKSSSNLELFYEGDSGKLNIRDLEIFKLKTPTINAGDRGGAFIKLKSDKIDPKRGAIIFDPVSSDERVIGKKFEIELKSEVDLNSKSIGPLFFGTNMVGNSKMVDVSGRKVVIETMLPIMFLKKSPLLIRSAPRDFYLANFIDIVT